MKYKLEMKGKVLDAELTFTLEGDDFKEIKSLFTPDFIQELQSILKETKK